MNDNTNVRGLQGIFSGCRSSYEVRCCAAKLHLAKATARADMSKTPKQPQDTFSSDTSAVSICVQCVDTLADDHSRVYVLLGTLNRALSSRVSALWNIREDGLVKKVAAATVLHCDVLQILQVYRLLLAGLAVNTTGTSSQMSTGGDSQHKSLLYSLLSHAVHKQLPAYITRINNFIRYIVTESTSEALTQYFKHHPHAFLVLQRNTGGLLTVLRSMTVCGSLAQDAATTQTEQAIYNMMKKYSIEPVHSTLSRAALLQYAPNCVQHVVVRFTALAFNSALQSLLDYILQHREPFDESGVYQLFRIILKLQEYISEVKKELQYEPAQRLIADTTVWTKAERILQTLNTAIFAEPGVDNTLNANQSGAQSPTNSRYRTVLTDEERTAWAKLANPYHTSSSASRTSSSSNKVGSVGGIHTSKSSGSVAAVGGGVSVPNPVRWFGAMKQRRKRHKGTVFIVLELDMQNL